MGVAYLVIVISHEDILCLIIIIYQVEGVVGDTDTVRDWEGVGEVPWEGGTASSV